MARVAASEFKAKCLAMLDEVAATGEELTITKRGKPVAKVVPATRTREDLRGSVRQLVSDEELMEPFGGWGTLEEWDELNRDA